MTPLWKETELRIKCSERNTGGVEQIAQLKAIRRIIIARSRKITVPQKTPKEGKGLGSRCQGTSCNACETSGRQNCPGSPTWSRLRTGDLVVRVPHNLVTRTPGLPPLPGLSAPDSDPELLVLPLLTQIVAVSGQPCSRGRGARAQTTGSPGDRGARNPLQRDRSRAPPPQRGERQLAAPMRLEQRGGATTGGGVNSASHLPADCPAAWERPPSSRPGRIPAA